MKFPPYFWKKSRSAYDLSLRADFILSILEHHHKAFLSQRETARILEVSVNTLNTWESLDILSRHELRKKYSVHSVIGFLKNVKLKAKPSRRKESYLPKTYPFKVIEEAKFEWSRNEPELTPRELARRIGCHVSTIMRVIKTYPSIAKNNTPYRWVLLRRRWKQVFWRTIIEKK